MSRKFEFILLTGHQEQEKIAQHNEGQCSCYDCGMKFANPQARDNHQCARKRKRETEEMNMILSLRNIKVSYALPQLGIAPSTPSLELRLASGYDDIRLDIEPPGDYTLPLLNQVERYLKRRAELEIEYQHMKELLKSEGEIEVDIENMDLTLQL